MSKLNKAKELADKGFKVFPLTGKLPLIDNFSERATRDHSQIERWWLDPVLEIERDYNIGISTDDIVVIDVDMKNGKNGEESLETLELLGKELPTTYTQITPSGGRHLVFQPPYPLKQGVNVIGSGLDIRAKGGYIVGSGSTVEAGSYTANSLTVSPAPAWLIDACGKPNEKDETPAFEGEINEEAANARAIFYLENECPPALAGERNHSGYKTACRLKDYGVSEINALELMATHWQCEPALDQEELESVIANAYRYGNTPAGSAAPESQFEQIDSTDDKTSENTHYLHQINKDHALIYMEGSHFVLHETVDEKGNYKRVFLNEATFKRKFSPNTLQKRGTYATEWLDWNGRREYAGVCFSPGKDPKHGYYNLWRGFTVTSLSYDKGTSEQRKGLDMFLDHARDNVCQGNETLFKWLLGYFAHMVQRPFERPLTTLVFRGSKGVGKNALVDRVGNLLGEQHYIVAHDGRYLTSNFNGHLDSCLCLVLDEAIWSGDKSAEGILKGVTTAPTIMIERKGKEPYRVDNLVRLIVIGNEDWLVPASTDERRYGVFDVGEGKKQDREFFKTMRVLLEEKGGNRLLLHYLQNYDLTRIDVNDAPKTRGLLDQKHNSLAPFEAWWFSCLSEGQIVNADFMDGEWPESIDTALFKSAFARTCKDMNIRSRLPNDTAMGMQFKKILPSVTKTKRREGDRTVWVYKLPSLNEARFEWSKFVGQEVVWE
jgi:hypothetical protein